VKFFLLIAAILLLYAPRVRGHETRPAYLEIRETAAGEYRVLWKRPILGEVAVRLDLRLPENCQDLEAPTRYATPGSLIERRSIKCGENGISGQAIGIDGLKASITDALARIEFADGRTWIKRLTPQEPEAAIPQRQSGWSVAWEYLKLGVEHILTGVDHLLFVLALIIIARGGWQLVKTVSAFTLSHSITLTAATLGFVHVPQRPVEAIIALSIVFVAAEIVHASKGRRGITARAPWTVAFTFGLLHGLGFAGGLSEVGLPAWHIPTALLFFSTGVEVGHLLFVAAVLSLIELGRRFRFSLPRWAELAPPYAIGSLAMFWVIQRVAAF
jgi:hydrogenase/urease accessory protein HupE